jgi:Fe-S oxidoreductase
MYEFKVSELAEEFGVHRNTIRNWIQSGTLPASPGPGRKYFMKFEEYLALCSKFHVEPRTRPSEQPQTVPSRRPVKSDISSYIFTKNSDSEIDLSLVSACIGCGTCAGACPISGIDNLDPRKAIRMASLGMAKDLQNTHWAWKCTLCAKCEESCPAGIAISDFMIHLRSISKKSEIAEPLFKTVQTCLETGNNLGIPKEDFIQLCESLGEELAGNDCPGFKAPLDVYGARLMVTVNSKEPYSEPDNMKWLWKILYAAGESWTIPSEYWEGANWAFFTGDEAAMKIFIGRLVDNMRRLKCRVLLLPECGHAYFATRNGLRKWFPEVAKEFKIITIFDLLLDYIQSGKIEIDKLATNKIASYQSPCHYSRKSLTTFGRSYTEDGMKLVRYCVPQFRELQPSEENSYCCGGGGGTLALPFTKERIYGGRLKARQIAEAGSNLVITACHNCRDQLRKSLNNEYDLNIEVKYLWQLVAEALVLPDHHSSKLTPAGATVSNNQNTRKP